MDEVGDRDEGVRASSRTGPADAGSSRATPTVAAVQLDARTLQTIISGVTTQLRGEGGARTLLPQMEGPGRDVSPQGTSEDKKEGWECHQEGCLLRGGQDELGMQQRE